MGTFYRPFSDPIYIGNDRIPTHNQLKEILVKLYEENKTGKNESFYASAFTSFFLPHIKLLDYKEFHPLRDIILNRCRQLIEDQLQYTEGSVRSEVANRPLKISEIWFNVNPPDAYQGKHHHADYLFGGTYYIQVPPKTGMIRFYNPNNFCMYKLYSREKDHLMKMYLDAVPLEGQLFLWPGFLDHEVTTNITTDQTRISVSFCVDWVMPS